MIFKFNILIIVACYSLELLSSTSFYVGFNSGVVKLSVEAGIAGLMCRKIVIAKYQIVTIA